MERKGPLDGQRPTQRRREGPRGHLATAARPRCPSLEVSEDLRRRESRPRQATVIRLTPGDVSRHSGVGMVTHHRRRSSPSRPRRTHDGQGLAARTRRSSSRPLRGR